MFNRESEIRAEILLNIIYVLIDFLVVKVSFETICFVDCESV